MKNRIFILLTVVALVGLFAWGCKKNESADTTVTSDTATSTASSTGVTASDTSGTTSTNPATSDTTGTATNTTSASGSASTPLSADDQKFVEKAADGGMAEVQLGQSMSPKAKNADVKAFADRMVTDHSKAGDELKQLASTKGITLPSDVDAKDKEAAQKVLSAKDSDKAYMSDMVKDHDTDVKDFEEASRKVKDPDLKAWIDKTLPVLKDHQKMAHDINGKLK